MTMYPGQGGDRPPNHPSSFDFTPMGEDDDGPLTVAEFHARWQALHDGFFRRRDDALRQLFADREALRRRVRERPVGLFKPDDQRLIG